MPIRPEMRALYPANWKEIRADILERDGHKCATCGLQNYATGWRDWEGNFYPCDPAAEPSRKVIRIVLTIAHVDNPDPADCRPDNLKALCQRCHNILDMPMRQRNARKTRHLKAGQPDLF